MTVFNKLLEALIYAQETDGEWWEELGSLEEAEEILSEIDTYKPDEYDTAQLADVLDQDFPRNEYEVNYMFHQYVSILKTQLRDNT